MSLITQNLGLYTDFYELTMAQGYFLNDRHQTPACFDYFFRKNPFGGGFTVFAGLEEVLCGLENFRFEEDGLKFLQEETGLDRRFVTYLKDFEFKGTIHAAQEGDLVFPGAPILRVDGTILETQLVETFLLNVLNFQSLIATKAARICHAARGKAVVDFGLRRAQGYGGIQASRGAAIGGAVSTSNVYSAFRYDLKAAGTQAHSWIMAYENELESFRAFASAFPENCILLVDTYDTLKSGVPNAITVAKEMEKRGHKMKGIRLDSGDLAYLSKRARKMLDDAGLDYVQIVVSNQLDEHLIKSLFDQGAPIDVFGVGTSLVTGQPDAALDGVYKLCYSDGKPRIKLSENIEKVTLPGKKKVTRLIDAEGFYADLVRLEDETENTLAFHPTYPDKFFDASKYESEELLHLVFENGKQTGSKRSIREISAFAKSRLEFLPDEYKRFENPHTYKVSISQELKHFRDKIIKAIKSK